MKQVLVGIAIVLSLTTLALFLVGVLGGQKLQGFTKTKTPGQSVLKASYASQARVGYKAVTATVSGTKSDGSAYPSPYQQWQNSLAGVGLKARDSPSDPYYYSYTNRNQIDSTFFCTAVGSLYGITDDVPLFNRCKTNFDNCSSAGNAAVGLLAISVIFIFACCVLIGMRLCQDSIAIVAAFNCLQSLVVVFAIAALANFSVNCDRPFIDLLSTVANGFVNACRAAGGSCNSKIDEAYLPGFIGPVTGIIFMAVAALLSALASPDTPPAPALKPSGLA